MGFEFNHTFIFVEKDFPEESLFTGGDLHCTVQRDHAGQGTSAKFIMFPNHYIEFIWISQKGDARNNIVPLLEKADWKNSGWNPFGIAFSGFVPEDEKQYFLEYRPSYSSGKSIWIDKRSMESKESPLLFFMEPAQGEGPESHRPSRFLKDRPETRICDNQIEKVIYYGPHFDKPSYLTSDLIEFSISTIYRLEVKLLTQSKEVSGEHFKVF